MPRSRSKDVAQIYFRDIGEIPLLSKEEEEELANKVRNGDEEARKKLIRANLRLVVALAKKYMNLGLSFLDLIEEGNIGLMKGIEKYDPDKGCRVSTYVSWWIKQAIMRALANQGKTIRIPVYMIEKISAINKAIINLSQKLGRPPSDEELAKETDLDVPRIQKAKRIAQNPSSLYATLNDDGVNELVDVLKNEDAVIPIKKVASNFIREDIMDLLNTLSDREEQILVMYFGLFDRTAYTLEEIGKQFGITRERVRQIKERAIEKLRQIQDQHKREYDDYHFRDNRL